ncbi:FAD-dependent pyridine nucleotide-disulfide oxidoreductase [Desulfovibrio sp. X2]|uniref:FAD-dependent oxidoreductase n=1 Tax=Desulfovibrio sp. X2 TaxID=941449 RepID=UPI0003587DED|nr:FAD-dependent oxidoreductase [Desulfovibrio sp. X2]EPR38741.1 FAD-dependent pyridine nucleotide-disulfide oxidoreductase [Desulfovibrio sp. X2]
MVTTSVLFLVGLGFGAAALLAIASRFLHVEEDPRIAQVEEALLGANCGGCGYPGCSGAAQAVVEGRAGPDVCVAGGPEVAQRVGALLGLEVVLREPEVAFHDCFGGGRAAEKYFYQGARDCRAQAMLYSGAKSCATGCLGLGSCVRACPFDALTLGPQGTPVINEARCRACGRCADVCPRGVLSVVSTSARLLHMNQEDECLAPCRQICPAQINIPQYIEQAKNGQYEAAIQTLKERNPLILSIGRVCPAPCEGYCRRAAVDDPVGINLVKRWLADWEMAHGRVCLPCARPTGRKVAIIGGGPAGLSCAFFLRRLGHSPTIFESQPGLGGQLRYGIPEYRLPKEVLDWEIQGILDLGIEARTGVQLGRDFTLEGLREEGFEAFFLGMGAWLNWGLGIDGEDAGGVWPGTEFLTEWALGRAPEVGKNVVIVGGGNTAIDAARTARRTGARVTIMYRRTEAEMPAATVEIHAAKEEGVEMLFLAAPTRVEKDGEGRIARLEFLRMELGEPDASGRRRPVPVEGSEETMDCDMLVAAIGQYPDTCYIEEKTPACEITRRKTVAVNPDTMQTAVPDVFAAGDLVTGPALVVTAIGGGRRAARGIHYYLMQGEIPVPANLQRKPLPETLFKELEGVGKVPRTRIPELCAEDRFCNFREVDQTISEEQLHYEAARCLRCGSTCYNRDPAPLGGIMDQASFAQAREEGRVAQ